MKKAILALSLLAAVTTAARAEAPRVAPDASQNVYSAAGPEPSRALLMGLGCAAALMARRRK